MAKKTKKKDGAWSAVLAALLLAMVFTGCEGNRILEGNFPCASGCQHKDTYEFDFEDDQVVVVIHESFQLKDFTVDDFKIVKAKEIIWLMPDVPPSIASFPVNWPIIRIILSNPGRQNVICAIELIKNLEFIYSAEPEFNFPAIDDL